MVWEGVLLGVHGVMFDVLCLSALGGSRDRLKSCMYSYAVSPALQDYRAVRIRSEAPFTSDELVTHASR